MRKFLFTLILAAAGTISFAQTLEEIQELMNKQQWDKAKEAIDKFSTNDKNSGKWETWYYKAHIYNTLSKDEKFKTTIPDAKMQAFTAYKKYIETDPKLIKGTLEQNVLLFDLYNSYFDEGAKSFDSKNFENAYAAFKNAYMIEEFVVSKGYTYGNFAFPSFDTALVQNIAVSALNAKKADDAALWYQKMAEKRIIGDDYKSVYEWLVQHYNDKKDAENRAKFMKLGRELYPASEYWCEVEVGELDEKDKLKRFARYEEVLAGECGSKYLLNYNYGVELYNYTYIGDSKPANYAELQGKLETILKKVLSINSTPEANLLMSRHYYNVIYDLQDAQKNIKGTKPEDIKKKNDLKAKMAANADLLIPYAQKAYDIYSARATLKPSEKGNFKVAADYLASAYELKGNKAKVDEYSKKRDAIQ